MDDFRIKHTPSHLWPEALELVFGDLSEEERAEQINQAIGEGQQNGATMEGLFHAERDGRVVGAVLTQMQPGKTANAWLPRLANDAAPATANALMHAMCRWLEGQGAAMAQVILATVPKKDRELLDFAHFTHLSDLFYLVAVNSQFPVSEPASMLDFLPITPDGEGRFAVIVEATYEATRDCEGLDGVRKMDDVLAGYRAVGRSGTSEWYLVRCEGEDIGCLILADHPPRQNLELVYMGVVPAWRGRGWGVEIAQWAQWRARLLGRRRLVLAVDTDNGPALAAYVAAGFRAWDRQSVYIRTFLS